MLKDLMAHSGPNRIQSFPVGQIDLEDTFFGTSPQWFPLGALEESVRRIGVLSPLHLEAKGPATFRIIIGFRRFRAALKAGLTSVPAILRRGDSKELFLQALSENASGRPLHLLEKALAVSKLLRQFSITQREVVKHYLPFLGVKPNLHEFRRLIDLAALGRHLHEAIVEQSLDPDVALGLGCWASDEQRLFLDYVEELHPGVNYQKELFELFDELRARDADNVMQLISRVEIERSAEREVQPQAKLQGLLSGLRSLRYPRLAEQEAKFRQLKGALRLPPEIRFQPPAYFEGEKFQVSFSAGDPETLRRLVERLAAAARQPEIEAVFRLL